jgi:2-keto-4-pentenoate hydratase/2-oxohepta-3-ene-1,7-dioic acid hydratase in catechol pathway
MLPPASYALARFHDGDVVRLGVVAGDRIRAITSEDLGAPSVNDFLAAPDWARVARLAKDSAATWRAVEDVVLAAPVEPRQVFQAGANYRSHVIDLVVANRREDDPRSVEEIREWAGTMMDDRRDHGVPYVFVGMPACVVGSSEPLVLPSYSDQHDWELELAVVIGPKAFRVSAEEAMNHVAGYTIVNDITTRDLVFRSDMKEIGTDFFRAKHAPGFLPTGPLLVPAPLVDPGQLRVTLDLNGKTMQDASTSDLLFDVAALVSYASQTISILPGDLLLTGSPSGNGTHWKRMLRDGDVMTGSIDGLGAQVVRCVAEANR